MHLESRSGQLAAFISVLWEALAELGTHSRDELARMGNQVAFAASTCFILNYLETSSASGVLYFTACREGC